jgi:hypothetical protein
MLNKCVKLQVFFYKCQAALFCDLTRGQRIVGGSGLRIYKLKKKKKKEKKKRKERKKERKKERTKE